MLPRTSSLKLLRLEEMSQVGKMERLQLLPRQKVRLNPQPVEGLGRWQQCLLNLHRITRYLEKNLTTLPRYELKGLEQHLLSMKRGYGKSLGTRGPRRKT